VKSIEIILPSDEGGVHMTKSIVLAGLLFGSSAAFACPDLSGTYVCTQDGQSSEMSVSQTGADLSTVYTVSENGESSSIPADGKTYTSTSKEDDGIFTQSTTATCSADALNLAVNVKVTDQAGNQMASVNANAVISLDASKNLQTVVSDDQGNNETSVCTRK
jgi:microcystin-dependent protein